MRMIYAFLIFVIWSTSEIYAQAQPVLRTTCPTQGFYQDSAGRCRYAIPYRPGIGSHNGQWIPLKITVEALDPREIDLGRYLFFDPVLSRDQDLSCGSCHDPKHGLADGRKVARGTAGIDLHRNSPTLWNTGFQERWFWDGRATSLNEQLHGPLFSPQEMAASPQLIEDRLNASQPYRQFFKQVYGKRGQRISTELVLAALVSFERSLVSFGSRFDSYILGDLAALSDEEVQGYNLFRSFLTRCAECHTPPLFTNQQRLFIGVPDGETQPRAFKVPTLRNLARTAPYMHAGQFQSLSEVVAFYNDGGGRTIGVEPRKQIHWHVRPIGLSSEEQRALVAFLGSLEDAGATVEVPPLVPSRTDIK